MTARIASEIALETNIASRGSVGWISNVGTCKSANAPVRTSKIGLVVTPRIAVPMADTAPIRLQFDRIVIRYEALFRERNSAGRPVDHPTGGLDGRPGSATAAVGTTLKRPVAGR